MKTPIPIETPLRVELAHQPATQKATPRDHVSTVSNAFFKLLLSFFWTPPSVSRQGSGNAEIKATMPIQSKIVPLQSKIVALKWEIVPLQLEIVALKSEIVPPQSEIVALKSEIVPLCWWHLSIL